MSATLKFPKSDSEIGRLLDSKLHEWRDQNQFPLPWISPEAFKETFATEFKMYEKESFRDHFNSIRTALKSKYCIIKIKLAILNSNVFH